jgi:hypothetical protein
MFQCTRSLHRIIIGEINDSGIVDSFERQKHTTKIYFSEIVDFLNLKKKQKSKVAKIELFKTLSFIASQCPKQRL